MLQITNLYFKKYTFTMHHHVHIFYDETSKLRISTCVKNKSVGVCDLLVNISIGKCIDPGP